MDRTGEVLHIRHTEDKEKGSSYKGKKDPGEMKSSRKSAVIIDSLSSC